MRTLHLSLTAAASAALFTLGAASAFADQAPPVPPLPSCEADGDCLETERCLFGSCQVATSCTSAEDCTTGWCDDDGLCAEPPSCEADAECGDGFICDWGTCAPRGRSCLDDADCGDYAVCSDGGGDTVVVVDGGEVPPSRGGGSSGSGSDSAEAPSGDPDGGAPYYEDPAYSEDPPYTEGPDRGVCTIDPDAVPRDAGCAALCEAAAACGLAASSGGSDPSPAVPPPAPYDPDGEGGGSAGDSGDPGTPASDGFAPPPEERSPSPAPPEEDEEEAVDQPSAEEIAAFVEMCEVTCSYGVALALPGHDGVGAALSCIEGVETCGADAVEAACADEFEAIEGLFEAVGDVVRVDDDGVGGSANDSETGGELGTPQPTNNDQGTRGSQQGSGCAGGPEAPVGALLVVLGLLVALRRRPRSVEGR